MPLPSKALLVVSALLGAGACDSLQVNTFDGAVIALSMPPPGVIPPGEHLELWAQRDGGRWSRVTPSDYDDPRAFPGFALRPAIDPNDPCMTDPLGHHLLNPADVPTEAERVECPDCPREGDRRALVQRVRQVLATSVEIRPPGKLPSGQYLLGRVTTSSLLVLTEQRLPAAPPAEVATTLESSAGAAARREYCSKTLRIDYNDNRNNAQKPYVGDPRQYTAPLSGHLFGFFDFRTTEPGLPTQSYGGITLVLRDPLQDVKGLLVSREPDDVPATAPTNVLVQSLLLKPEDGGRGVVRLALLRPPTPPATTPTAIGSASVITGLAGTLE